MLITLLNFADDYTNTEYLEIDEEDIKEDEGEEIIPLEFSSMTKVIRVSIPQTLSLPVN